MKKILLLGWACFLLCCFTACQSDAGAGNTAATAPEDNTVYQRVEFMPRFPGCEDQPRADRSNCASPKMFKFIRESINYPEAAKAAGEEGRAIVSFVIDKKGKITDAKVVRDPGYGMGEEALRVINSFPDWMPGMHDGKVVKVQYNLPVKFKLK